MPSDVHKRHDEVFDRVAELLEKFRTAATPSVLDNAQAMQEALATVEKAEAVLRHLRDEAMKSPARGVISVSEARRDFSAICNRAAFGKERVAIGRHGKNRVAVIPYEDLELLEELEDRLDLRAALAALKEAEEEGTIAWDDAKRDLGL